ncbi:(deoxy)nucleoside triphosphate pyrophosphohydrolase [Actinotalea sp.]|uniref:(deoxy)nucleoside triphosphate pyrophosphohydrolase n=1 Tax=Actinotalea sp. TaxID=1872145 RepID=UPI003564ECD0
MIPTPVLVVAVAILDDLDRPSRLLAARRSRPEHLAGRWEFPGGKVDPGETPHEAVHREVREELGVRVALGTEVRAPRGTGWPITERHVLRLWTAVVIEGDPAPLVEHDELRWLDRPDWHGMDWLDGDVAIVHELARLADAAR